MLFTNRLLFLQVKNKQGPDSKMSVRLSETWSANLNTYVLSSIPWHVATFRPLEKKAIDIGMCTVGVRIKAFVYE